MRSDAKERRTALNLIPNSLVDPANSCVPTLRFASRLRKLCPVMFAVSRLWLVFDGDQGFESWVEINVAKNHTR